MPLTIFLNLMLKDISDILVNAFYLLECKAKFATRLQWDPVIANNNKVWCFHQVFYKQVCLYLSTNLVISHPSDSQFCVKSGRSAGANGAYPDKADRASSPIALARPSCCQPEFPRPTSRAPPSTTTQFHVFLTYQKIVNVHDTLSFCFCKNLHALWWIAIYCIAI